MNNKQPLAEFLRPNELSEIIGQNHLLNEDSLINRMVKNHKLYSLIFYGPPGVGKTTIALATAKALKIPYAIFNAATDDKTKLNQYLDLAKLSSNGYILICEEIHRLNRDKQDILLPFLEKGIIYLFACTTENPYFIVNPAIRSRCQIIELQPLKADNIFNHLQSLIKSNKIQLKINDDALWNICEQANGDYRNVLNIIDILINLYSDIVVTNELIQKIFSNNNFNASHYGDMHYDTLSALHKSLRGSDVDAALYYGAILIKQKDFVSLNRRLIACCYEDIGLANPQLCDCVINGIKAIEIVGYPECIQIYGCILIEMALSPKSNSAYKAIHMVLDTVGKKTYSIPNHIKDQSYASAGKLNHSGYKYPHDYGGYVDQQYLPDALKGIKFYTPTLNGIEDLLQKWIKSNKKD